MCQVSADRAVNAGLKVKEQREGPPLPIVAPALGLQHHSEDALEPRMDQPGVESSEALGYMQ